MEREDLHFWLAETLKYMVPGVQHCPPVPTNII